VLSSSEEELKVALIAGPSSSLGKVRYASCLLRSLRGIGAKTDMYVLTYRRNLIGEAYSKIPCEFNTLEYGVLRLPVLEKTANRILNKIFNMPARKLIRKGYNVYHVVDHWDLPSILYFNSVHPNVLTCHDLAMYKVEGYPKKGFARLIKFFNNFDAIICPSSNTMLDLKDFIINSDKMHVIYHGGAAPEFIPMDKRVAKERLNIPNKK